jgi:hypothetical protein
MQLDAYTDDVICNAMGLGQFEPPGVSRAIRLLLKPSFHPEVCVTLEPTVFHVVALRSMLWREQIPTRLPEFAQAVAALSAQFETSIESFHRAATEYAAESKRICLDGMSFSALLRTDNERTTFCGHPSGVEQKAFVAEFLQRAHAMASSVHLRNRIAQCGLYVDSAFTIEPEPESPDTTHMMILGATEDRADYFNSLRRKAQVPRKPTFPPEG